MASELAASPGESAGESLALALTPTGTCQNPGGGGGGGGGGGNNKMGLQITNAIRPVVS